MKVLLRKRYWDEVRRIVKENINLVKVRRIKTVFKFLNRREMMTSSYKQRIKLKICWTRITKSNWMRAKLKGTRIQT